MSNNNTNHGTPSATPEDPAARSFANGKCDEEGNRKRMTRLLLPPTTAGGSMYAMNDKEKNPHSQYL
jgi:hypothetical protein